MNTIIIHPNNRPIHTAMHDLSAALIAPVSKWYRKPMPWWVDGFEEVRLLPISEADEFVEESEMDKSVLGGDKIEDSSLAGEVDILKDVKRYINGDDEFDVALNGISSSQIHVANDIQDTPRDSGSKFVEKIIGDDGDNSVLVDQAIFMEVIQEVERDGEVAAFADMSFSDEGITLVLEWHETMVSVVVELNTKGGKAKHDEWKSRDEDAEIIVDVDKGNECNEVVWDGDVAWKPKPGSF